VLTGTGQVKFFYVGSVNLPTGAGFGVVRIEKANAANRYLLELHAYYRTAYVNEVWTNSSNADNSTWTGWVRMAKTTDMDMIRFRGQMYNASSGNPYYNATNWNDVIIGGFWGVPANNMINGPKTFATNEMYWCEVIDSAARMNGSYNLIQYAHLSGYAIQPRTWRRSRFDFSDWTSWKEIADLDDVKLCVPLSNTADITEVALESGSKKVATVGQVYNIWPINIASKNLTGTTEVWKTLCRINATSSGNSQFIVTFEVATAFYNYANTANQRVQACFTRYSNTETWDLTKCTLAGWGTVGFVASANYVDICCMKRGNNNNVVNFKLDVVQWAATMSFDATKFNATPDTTPTNFSER
jgi:hypothetical protein